MPTKESKFKSYLNKTNTKDFLKGIQDEILMFVEDAYACGFEAGAAMAVTEIRTQKHRQTKTKK